MNVVLAGDDGLIKFLTALEIFFAVPNTFTAAAPVPGFGAADTAAGFETTGPTGFTGVAALVGAGGLLNGACPCNRKQGAQ